ncbi:MAG: acylphosphatase [Solobacterium sp.]|nr:acylphosphatase [Solobacterium sp.]
MKRYHMIIEGRVQGVGFRGFCMSHALRYGITGSVRNMDNGMVELYAQGEEADLNRLIADIRAGDRFIRVDDITIKETAVDPKEKKFRYDYSSGWY